MPCSCTTPVWPVFCNCAITLSSLRTLLPMRAATILRWPTSPAVLATCNPCKATGMTMAINSSAASTSASVKPERRRDALAAVGLNFIFQMRRCFRDPDLCACSLAQVHVLRAGVADKTVGLKSDFGDRAEMRRGLRPVIGMRQSRGGWGQCDLHAGVHAILFRFGLCFRVTRQRLQPVGTVLRVDPEFDRDAFVDGAALSVASQRQKPQRLVVE